jgi:hypothetical protein
MILALVFGCDLLKSSMAFSGESERMSVSPLHNAIAGSFFWSHGWTIA